jgi:glycosyltransferase involved in cell wall biosynthesis
MTPDTARSDIAPPGESAPGISIVFPMFNERDYVRKTVALALRTLRGITDDYEIVIVDDASTDGCGEIADGLARENPRIRVFHHGENGKLGTTLRTGFARAEKEIVVYSDMDLPFDLDEIRKALRVLYLNDSDIVTAYRLDRTSEGPRRALYSGVYNMLIRVLFGVRVRDINFAFKVVRRRVLESVPLESSGSFIDAELVVKASRAGFRVSQFGIDYFARSRGASTLSSIPVIINLLKDMLRFRISLFRSPAPPDAR